MSKVIRYMPELTGEEQLQVAKEMKDMTEEQAMHFSHVHRQRRKDETVTLILALVGIFGFAGLHRFYLGQVGMGLLYFLTGGLCLIGTIVDVFNIRPMVSKYNLQEAHEAARLIHGAFPELEAVKEKPALPPSEPFDPNAA